jgi:hypothetical protein
MRSVLTLVVLLASTGKSAPGSCSWIAAWGSGWYVQSNTGRRYRRDAPIAVNVPLRRWRAKRSPKCVLYHRGAEELCPARDRNQYLVRARVCLFVPKGAGGCVRCRQGCSVCGDQVHWLWSSSKHRLVISSGSG